MFGSMGFLVLTVSLLASLPVVVLSSNINIDGTCYTSVNCMQCLARGSSDVERCQQLYYYITYVTGNSITKTNKVEVDRYCNGDCPIILATANYFCNTQVGVDNLLTMCPGYSVEPTGSFNVDPEPEWRGGSSCLPSSSSSSSPPSQCLQCIGKNTREATRCLQLYLFASSINTSSTYAGRFCEKNCPLTLQSTNWYCSGYIKDSYSYCEESGSGNYCGVLQLQEDFQIARQTCLSDCSSFDCTSAFNKYGCCLARSLVDICSYVGQCSLSVKASTTNIHVDSTCSISDCNACLSRENEELEKCEQLYSYLEAADGLQSNDFASVTEKFCSGKCPILLLTSDYYCAVSNNRVSNLWKLCPSYNKIPSRSVDVRASYGNGFSCPVRESCEECVGSHSPEPTRCLQLLLLSGHPNMTNFYLEEYCKGNCPLTLATSEWYCSGQEDTISALFNVCKRTDNNSLCQVLAQDETFEGAVQDCVNDCSSTECKEAKQIFRCCLNVNGLIPAECGVPECSILTAGAPSPSCASHLLLVIFCILVHQIINILWW